MICLKYFKIIMFLCWIKYNVNSMNPQYLSDDDIAQLLSAKVYIPDDEHLPKPSIVKNNENDATYILSKLSDDELIKLLNTFPTRTNSENDVNILSKNIEDNARHEPADVAEKENQSPVFRLENKEIDPYTINSNADPMYNALKKLNNMFYSRPHDDIPLAKEDDEKKEIIFDILVDQLKTLCCKRKQPEKLKSKFSTKVKKVKKPTEHIFLVLNDELKSNTSDELIPVDPDSLSSNSSVLLLGPITTPLSDAQTKLVISRITNEISKPEYLPLLKRISEGKISKQNSDLMKSLISGPETRRYIKPHRCNYQSKLAKVYGGPRWIICTGYLNLNTPSLYD